MPLTDEMKADGWIEYDGGPCPVPPDTRIKVKFLNGLSSLASAKASWWLWEQPREQGYLIIAYKVVPND